MNFLLPAAGALILVVILLLVYYFLVRDSRLLVKKFRVIKIIGPNDTKPANDNESGWRTFQIAEIKAYSDNKVLTPADFSSIVYGKEPGYDIVNYPATNAYDNNINTFAHTGGLGNEHTLEFTLKTPQIISKVELSNRQDCCPERLSNSKLEFIDENNNVVGRFSIFATKKPQVFLWDGYNNTK